MCHPPAPARPLPAPRGRCGSPPPGRTGHVGDIPGGGISLDGGVGGEDQFADVLFLQPALENIEPQLLRAYAVQRRQMTHQHKVATGELAGLLDGRHVRRALYHTEQTVLFALGVGADIAAIVLGKGAAVAAVANLGQGAREQLGQPQTAAALTLEQGKGHPLADLGPTPGNTCRAFIISSSRGLNFITLLTRACPSPPPGPRRVSKTG